MARCLIHYKLCMLKYCKLCVQFDEQIMTPENKVKTLFLHKFHLPLYGDHSFIYFFFHSCFFIFFVCVWLALGLMLRHCGGRATSYHRAIGSWASTACKQDFSVLNSMSQDLLTQTASTHCQLRACK